MVKRKETECKFLGSSVIERFCWNSSVQDRRWRMLVSIQSGQQQPKYIRLHLKGGDINKLLVLIDFLTLWDRSKDNRKRCIFSRPETFLSSTASQCELWLYRWRFVDYFKTNFEWVGGEYKHENVFQKLYSEHFQPTRCNQRQPDT